MIFKYIYTNINFKSIYYFSIIADLERLLTVNEYICKGYLLTKEIDIIFRGISIKLHIT